MRRLGFLLVAGLLVAGCSNPGGDYVRQEAKQANAGNHWAEFQLWTAYAQGAHGVDKNSAKADKWLAKFVKDVYVVRFEPANGFHPRNAGDYLKNMLKSSPECQSARNGIGVAGFFRTKRDGDKLVASFLSTEPNKLQGCIENNPDLRFISAEPMTAQSFVEYNNTIQESL